MKSEEINTQLQITKPEVTFTTTTMPTFMNELTQVTGGDFRFEDDASGFVITS